MSDILREATSSAFAISTSSVILVDCLLRSLGRLDRVSLSFASVS